MTPTPGANRSRHGPKLENDALASLVSVAPTVSAFGVRAGDCEHAVVLLLPADTAYVTPDAIDAVTAASMASLADPPRLMLATAGDWWFAVTQSTPAMTPAQVPLPEQPSTRTECRKTSLATPHVSPPMVPATWVPWP